MLLACHTGCTKEGKTTIVGTRTMVCNGYHHQGRSLWVGVSISVGQDMGSDSGSKEHKIVGICT